MGPGVTPESFLTFFPDDKGVCTFTGDISGILPIGDCGRLKTSSSSHHVPSNSCS